MEEGEGAKTCNLAILVSAPASNPRLRYRSNSLCLSRLLGYLSLLIMADAGSFVLIRSTLIYAPAILLTRISALLLLALSTRLVSQTEFGLLTLVVTIGELTDSAITNWLRISLLRLGGTGEVSRGSIVLSARALLVSTLLAMSLAIVASLLVAPDRATEFAFAVCAYLLAGAVGRFSLTILQMQQRHATYSLLEALRAVLQLTLPVAAVLVWSDTFLTLSIASSVGALLAGAVAATVVLAKVSDGPARFTQRQLLTFGAPIVVVALVGFGLNSAERIFLKIYYDAAAVAIFAAAFSLARQPIDMLANAVNMGAFPELVGKFDKEGPRAAANLIARQLALMLTLCLPAAALLIGLSGDIGALVLPTEYQGWVKVLFPIIALSVLCSNVTNFTFGNVLYAHKKPWWVAFSGAVGSIVTIALAILLIPPFAQTGAALALLGGTAAGLIACALVSRRFTPIPIPWKSIAISTVIAALTGGVAAIVSGGLGEAIPIVKLVLGAAAGGLVFLAANAVRHQSELLPILARVRAKLRPA